MGLLGSIAGGLVSGGLGLIGGSMQNNAAQSMMNQSEAFNEYMSDTVYQRGVNDLKAAGLNPMLAVGAADPAASVSQAPVVNALGQGLDSGLQTFSAGQQARATQANIDNTQSQTALNQANSIKSAADTAASIASAKQMGAQTQKIESGSFLADLIGSTAAHKLTNTLNNLLDNVYSSASKLSNKYNVDPHDTSSIPVPY